jgi:bifunctional ADP-heptose synthase (sugar kinase/adenylyltransferase)
MDTRSKVLTAEAAHSLAGPLVIVAGWFDLLGALHAKELTAIRARHGAARILAVVLPASGTVFSQPARAEMAAALRMIDYVVSIDDRDLPGLAAALQPVEIVRLEAAEARHAHELRAHVRSRQA